jgi:hypothetical protein
VVLAPASSHSNATERVQTIGSARTSPSVPVSIPCGELQPARPSLGQAIYFTDAASFLTSALLQTFTEAFTLTEKPFPGM